MSKTRFFVSPVKGRPSIGIIQPHDGPRFWVYLAFMSKHYDEARADGLYVPEYESPHWREALPVEIPLLVQELEPTELEYIPDLADLLPL